MPTGVFLAESGPPAFLTFPIICQQRVLSIDRGGDHNVTSHTTGVEQPLPGKATRHSHFASSVSCTGYVPPVALPFSFGPRQVGQLSAVRKLLSNNVANEKHVTNSFMCEL